MGPEGFRFTQDLKYNSRIGITEKCASPIMGGIGPNEIDLSGQLVLERRSVPSNDILWHFENSRKRN